MPLFVSEKSNAAGAVTFNEKVVVCASDPAVPVTVTVDVPGVADADAVSVSVLLHVGEQLGALNEPVTPVGRPDTLYVTACVAPDASVAVTRLVTAFPCTTDWLPELASEKSNAAATVNVNVVVCVSDPAVPVTVTVDVPTVADAEIGRASCRERV